MHVGKGASCFYRIGKFVTINTNASPPHHLQSSPKCISHYTQHYYKYPILSISGSTRHLFLPDFPFKISNTDLLSATTVHHQHYHIPKADTKLHFVSLHNNITFAKKSLSFAMLYTVHCSLRHSAPSHMLATGGHLRQLTF
jgi:hypothetical protein